MRKNKFKREPINMEELKKTEIEEKKEEVKELMKELANFSTENELPTRAKEDLEKNEKLTKTELKKEIEIIKKLKCDYKLFKDERIKNKMFVPDNCESCNNIFKSKDNIYVAITKQKKELFICKNCAKK